MHRVTRLRMTTLNQHLMCVLCGGYLIDATVSTECLHAFCRSCITKYTEGCKTCPICDTLIHKTRPHINLKPDKTLQDLVYKLVPGLFESEMKRRRDFYEKNPCPEESNSLNADEERGRVKGHYDCATKIEDEEKISLCLQVANRLPPYKNCSTFVNQGSDSMDSDCRYLLCPASMPIGILDKFLRSKFDMSPKLQVDFFHSDERLSDDTTLIDVASLYGWLRKEPLRLFYLVYDPAELRVPPLTLNVHAATQHNQLQSSQEVKSHLNTLPKVKKKKKKKKELRGIKLTLKASSKAFWKSKTSFKKSKKPLPLPLPSTSATLSPSEDEQSPVRRVPSTPNSPFDTDNSMSMDSEYSDFSSAENTPQKLSVETIAESQHGIRIRIRRSSGKEGDADKSEPKKVLSDVTDKETDNDSPPKESVSSVSTPLGHSMDSILARSSEPADVQEQPKCDVTKSGSDPPTIVTPPPSDTNEEVFTPVAVKEEPAVQPPPTPVSSTSSTFTPVSSTSSTFTPVSSTSSTLLKIPSFSKTMLFPKPETLPPPVSVAVKPPVICAHGGSLSTQSPSPPKPIANTLAGYVKLAPKPSPVKPPSTSTSVSLSLAKKRPFSQTNKSKASKTDCGPLPKVAKKTTSKRPTTTQSAFIEPQPPPPPHHHPHTSSTLTTQPRGLFSPSFHYPHSPIFSQYQYSPVNYQHSSSPHNVPLVYSALSNIPSPPTSSCEPLDLITQEVRNRHIREGTTTFSTRRMS